MIKERDLVELVARNSKLKSTARFWLLLLRSYFRVQVEGIENIPAKGGAMIVPNHSGFAGADAVLLTYVIKRETRRRARILAHRAFFDFSDTLRDIAESHGLRKASIANGADVLKSKRLLVIFPEGETGNFKASYRRYRLQKFHTGFLRMAIDADCPVIPCTIVGAEESHLNLGNLNLSSVIKSLRIPLPLNLVPLPAKWKITFHPPIPASELAAEDAEGLKANAEKLRKKMQAEIDAELERRPYVYTPQTRKFADKLASMVAKRVPWL